MNLSKNFTLEQLTVTEHRPLIEANVRYGNEHIVQLRRVAGLLDIVQWLLNAPLTISSGVRCPALNAAVGGSASSAHLKGLAADFTCPAFGTPYDIARRLAKAKDDGVVEFDQVIYEYGRWVHVGLAEGHAPRGQLLSIHSAAEGYKPGIVLKGLA